MTDSSANTRENSRLMVWAAREGISARIVVPCASWRFGDETLKLSDGREKVAEFDRSAILGVSVAVDGIEDNLDEPDIALAKARTAIRQAFLTLGSDADVVARAADARWILGRALGPEDGQ